MGTRRPPMHLQRARPWAAAVAGDEAHHTVRLAANTSTFGVRICAAYATSQASGMLSVSRVCPMPTAMSASAGPVTRCSSARLEASATLT